jgi:glycosyltransferase involved in cell wall biosynthesis
MIVKNESQVIRRCLESVKPMIDYWVIVDTGSTDGTQEIIREFMKDIPGELHERPWKNFAHNRNEALQLAKGKADYRFFIDADDKLIISPTFKKKKLDKEFYFLNINYDEVTYDRLQMIGNGEWHWIGVIHEACLPDDPMLLEKVLDCRSRAAHLLDDVTMYIIGGGDRSSDPQKYLKDAAVLEQALIDEPNNARYVFYLAQSYRDSNIPLKSIENYEKRVKMGGWDQEVYCSLYNIARQKEILQMPEEEVCRSYNKAFIYRPRRVEPLFRLAEHYYMRQNYLLAYMLSQFGLELNAKAPIELFVEKWIYDWGFVVGCADSALALGVFAKAKWAYETCLSLNMPERYKKHVENNLKLIESTTSGRL